MTCGASTSAALTLNVFERGAGPAVVFIHGFPLNHAMWMRQLDELAANNRLIAPDLRGFGRSTRNRRHCHHGAIRR